ncbi:MAG: hypothetical protein ACREXY_25860 [Gammaproteobacteria bacterium]
MLRDEDAPKNQQPKPPCAGCSVASDFEVWGHALCKRCSSAWVAASPQTPPDGADTGNAQIYAEFTKRWIQERKQKTRAA